MSSTLKKAKIKIKYRRRRRSRKKKKKEKKKKGEKVLRQGLKSKISFKIVLD